MASSSMRAIRCLTLDVTGTILGFRRKVGEVYASAAERAGLTSVDALALHRKFKDAYTGVDGEFPCVGGEKMETKEWWHLVVSRTFRSAGLPHKGALFEGVFEDIYWQYGQSSTFVLFPDVIPLLKFAKEQGWRLGILSNESERYSDELLPQFGIDHYFDFMVFAKHVRARKPEAEIFQAAACAATFRPDNIVHIGDDPVKDFQGARRAGFQSLLLSRSASETNLLDVKEFLNQKAGSLESISP